MLEIPNVLLKQGFKHVDYSYKNIARGKEEYLKSWGHACIARCFFASSVILSLVKTTFNLIACIFTGMQAIYTWGQHKTNYKHYSKEFLKSLNELIKGLIGLITPAFAHYIKDTDIFTKLKDFIHYFRIVIDIIFAFKIAKYVLQFLPIPI